VIRHLPNAISVLRGLSVVPLAVLLALDVYAYAFFVALLAGLSDLLDGWLAKRFGWVTPAGAWLDPIADKLFVVVCFAMLALNGLAPHWLLWLIIARDAILLLGSLAWHWFLAPLEVQPRRLGKLTTFLEVLTLLVVLANAASWDVALVYVQIGIALVALATVASSIDYVWHWAYKAHRKKWSPSE